MEILLMGASGGIGFQLLTHLAKNNNIFALTSNQKSAQALKKQISNKNVKVLNCDVSNKNEVKKLFLNITSLDILVNAAAILGPVGPFLENDLDLWEKTQQINFLGTVYCCYFALPLLLKSKNGKIINFSGGGSAYSRPYHSAYASSKTALVRFTEILADEYPKVDINIIAPGAYQSRTWSKNYEKEPNQWGDIERLKLFIDFLISKDSKGITGKFIHYKDDWNKDDFKNLNKDLFTLRRTEK